MSDNGYVVGILGHKQIIAIQITWNGQNLIHCLTRTKKVQYGSNERY